MNYSQGVINMTEEELRAAYFELIQDELNNFKDKTLETVKAPVRLAVDKLVEYDSVDRTVSSESISDLSQSFFQLDGFPSDVKALLKPYRTVRW